MGTSDIARLTLGKSTAEFESEKLEGYFVSTLAYLNAKDPNKQKIFYIGHRGTGKSALLDQLSREYSRDGYMVLKITPSEFSYELFEKREHDYTDARSVYGAVWHYTLMIQLFRKTVEYFSERPNIRTNRDNVNILKEYLVERDFFDDPDLIETFFALLRDFAKRQLTSKLKNVEVESKRRDGPFSKVLNLREMNYQLTALKKILSSYPICLIIDELDTGWDSSKESKAFIYGLFYAVKQIRGMAGVTILVSLRADMYNSLRKMLPDAEKMRDDIERFTWDRALLRGLIYRRIIAFWPTDELKAATVDQAISAVFDEAALDYILDHSLNRPREIIQFCNDALDEYKRRAQVGENVPPVITLEVVRAIEPTYSAYRFEDLCEEYKHQYPGIRDLLCCFENAPEYWTIDQLVPMLEDAMLKAHSSEKENEWLAEYFDATKSLIEVLYEIGFFKVHSRKDDRYVAYYEAPILKIDNVTRLKIHDLFASALKCHL